MESIATIDALVRNWAARAKVVPGNEYLYEGFDAVASVLGEAKDTGVCVRPWVQIVLRRLIKEISYGLRPRLTKCDIFSLRGANRRNGNYILCRRHDFTGPCGGPHIEMLFELAPTWNQYVARCYCLVARLHATELLLLDWKNESLTQEQCDELSYPLRPHKVEGHRGCAQASFNCRLDNRVVSELLGNIGFLPPVAEKRYLDHEGYPPDESLLAHPDDQVFSGVLMGITKSRSTLARDILMKFMYDDEDWVRRLAVELLARLDGS